MRWGPTGKAHQGTFWGDGKGLGLGPHRGRHLSERREHAVRVYRYLQFTVRCILKEEELMGYKGQEGRLGTEGCKEKQGQ